MSYFLLLCFVDSPYVPCLHIHCTYIGAGESIYIGAGESISDHASRLGVQERKLDVNVFETMDVRLKQLVDISTMDVRQNQCADLLKVCTVSASVVIPNQELGSAPAVSRREPMRGSVGFAVGFAVGSSE
ncbi:uncharacterized protein LOC119361204 [Triticum dicoccoides]|uniref:uncharacterized protein LOC119361204 n=1 Tax=Triticum dicoccoides TaxID=85692 RepID=UPI00188FC99E|nr:uncharacterized protein LOC119361204 [Triticum dicoccoides]